MCKLRDAPSTPWIVLHHGTCTRVKMYSLIRRNKTLARYLFVGGTGVLFELVVIFVMVRVFSSSDSLAVTMSYWLGVLVSFLLQKFFAFKSRDVRAKTVTRQIIFFGLLLVFNYIFTLVFVQLTGEIINIYLARIIALVITTMWNFYVYKKIIFKNGNRA